MANNSKIEIGSLYFTVKKELELYNQNIITGIKKEANIAIKSLVKKTKQYRFKRDTGRYKKAISSRTLEESIWHIKKQWYVKAPQYRLSHLLNNGHALKNGGRFEGYNFITDSANEVNKNYFKSIQEVIKNG